MHFNNTVSLLKTLSLVCCMALSLILTACGNSEDAEKVKEALEVNQLDITSIQLTSNKSIMEALETLQLTAQAVIGDGSEEPIDISDKVTWSSSDNDIASINSSGFLTGKSIGIVTITAKLADLIATKEIQLSAALLESIDITNIPSSVSVCRSGYSLKADGHYDDSTIRDITTDVTWSSDNSARLSINESGEFSTYMDGTSIVSAEKNNISGSTNIIINDDIDSIQISSEASSVYIGDTIAFTAMGTYDDMTSEDITDTVTWTSDDTSKLAISNDAPNRGTATGVAAGSAAISASCLTTVSNELPISIAEEPVVSGIAIEEDETIIEFKLVDSPEQLTANLTRSDGTYSTDVSDTEYTTWTIDETISGEAVSLNSTGEITFSAIGITRIEVRYYNSDDNVGPFTDTIEVEIVTN